MPQNFRLFGGEPPVNAMKFLIRVNQALQVLFSKDFIFELSIEEAFRIVAKPGIKFFVQIGSNDGKKNDPLHNYIVNENWEGILVEPDPVNFKKLAATYSGIPQLILENIGIAPERGELLFYRLKDVAPNEPAWYDQVGSFDQSTFQKNISYGRDLNERIEILSLPVITFDDLLIKHHIEKIDLLYIDAEGFDYRILRSIDFEKYPVRLIIFEAEWMTQSELRDIAGRLRGFQYQVFRSGGDYIAISR